jgi:hypothetical protein
VTLIFLLICRAKSRRYYQAQAPRLQINRKLYHALGRGANELKSTG